MKKLRKIWSLLLAVLMVLSATGCRPAEGGSTQMWDPPDTGPQVQATESTGATSASSSKPDESDTTAPSGGAETPSPSDPLSPATAPSGPDVTEPSVTEPSVTEPQQTEATQPSASEPAGTDPSETEPAQPVAHTHSYTESYTPPACYVFGYYTYTCQCGHSYTKEDTSIPPNDHKYVPVYEPNPNDPFTEFVTSTCSACGDVIHFENIARKVDPAVLDQIEERTIYYINQYRLAEGTPACEAPPVFQLVADYRAKQLLDNFAHDGGAQKEACAAYQYGKYMDATLYGDDASLSYYTFGGGEAIAKGFKGGEGGVTIDGTAKFLADLIYGSKNHWSYIGSANEITMACGIAWDYMEIVGVVMVSHENYG